MKIGNFASKNSLFLGLILLATSLSLQSCSHKPAPLEEEGDPPMTTMEMKAPVEDTTEQWKLEVKHDGEIMPGKPVKLELHTENVTGGADAVASAAGTSTTATSTTTSPGTGSPPTGTPAATTGAGETSKTNKLPAPHLVVICKDGNEFQSISPTQSGTDYSADVTFPHPGQYVVCLQFVTAPHKNHTLTAPVQVGKGTTGLAKRKLDADTEKSVNGYEFSLRDYPEKTDVVGMPTFRITKDKRPVSNIEPIDQNHPNDAGYAVLISDDSQNFVQTVPVTTMAANSLFQTPIMFHTQVRKPGTYKIWAQFKIDGKLTTVDYSFKVKTAP